MAYNHAAAQIEKCRAGVCQRRSGGSHHRPGIPQKAVVSLIAVKAVHWFHVPNHVLTIPSVIPMVPGVLMYRSLLALINMRGVVGEVTLAFSNGINSALIIFCIALGVAVPNIFARRYIAKDRQRFLTQMLAERRVRGKFIEW